MKTLTSSALSISIAYWIILAPLSYGDTHETTLVKKPPLTNQQLAQKAQNPISDLTSALIENGFDMGVGTSNGLQYVLNLEEFYPVRISEGLNLVQRFVLPIIAQPELIPGQGSHGGLGDTQYQAYLTSVNSDGLIFGLGPIVSAPSAYPSELGSGKWSMGPTTSIVAVTGNWVIGALLNQLWSVSTYNNRPSVSQMLIQPFLYLNFPDAWYIAASPKITANWKAGIGDRWTVPVGGGVGKVVRFGKLPVKTEFQGFDTIVSPQQGPNWSMQLQFQFLFPSERENQLSL